MKKFIASLFATGLLAFSMGLILPWWSISIAGIIPAFLIPQKRYFSFLSAFLAVFIFWGALAAYISLQNDHILAHRISILVLKKDDPFLLILVTALIGGVVSGISAVTSRSLSILVRK
jgi:hypothetical protein